MSLKKLKKEPLLVGSLGLAVFLVLIAFDRRRQAALLNAQVDGLIADNPNLF